MNEKNIKLELEELAVEHEKNWKEYEQTLMAIRATESDSNENTTETSFAPVLITLVAIIIGIY